MRNIINGDISNADLFSPNKTNLEKQSDSIH